MASWLGTALVTAAFAAHGQTGSLAYSGATSCTSFQGFTWTGSQLTILCSAPVVAACDTTRPGNFTFTGTGTTIARGATASVQVQRTGGCAGAYTITFGNNIGAAAPGSSVAPAASVAFADGDASPKTITFTAGTTPGTAALWLTGFLPASSAQPGIAGSYTVTVQ